MRRLMLSILLVPGLVACNGSSTSAVSSTGSAIMVFHTRDAVLALRDDDFDHSRFRQRVEDFFPSACVDRDHDDDGIPDSVDEHDRSSTGDAGVAGEDDDLANDTPAEQAVACSRCNRGPGTAGDFRLEIEGASGKLDRGRVIAASGGTLTVASPDGGVTIVIGSRTEVKDGAPAPGAEIRAEGSVTRNGTTVTIAATRVEVLCDAPPAMPADQVPPGAQPIPSRD